MTEKPSTDARARIAELERERDEMRATRDHYIAAHGKAQRERDEAIRQRDEADSALVRVAYAFEARVGRFLMGDLGDYVVAARARQASRTKEPRT